MSGKGKSSGTPGGGKPRRHPGVKGRRPDNYAHRASEALERAVAWGALSPAEQLAALDRRLGVGVGAKRQRARIAKAHGVVAKKGRAA